MPPLTELRALSLKARNLKCFADWQGFDGVLPVNVIVGRNNAGKSTLLDLVSIPINGFSQSPLFHRAGEPTSIQFSYQITKPMAEEAFEQNSGMLKTPRDALRKHAENCQGIK